jgi:hypothetical protein
VTVETVCGAGPRSSDLRVVGAGGRNFAPPVVHSGPAPDGPVSLGLSPRLAGRALCAADQRPPGCSTEVAVGEPKSAPRIAGGDRLGVPMGAAGCGARHRPLTRGRTPGLPLVRRVHSGGRLAGGGGPADAAI